MLIYLGLLVIIENPYLKSIETLFTFVGLTSFQEIFVIGEDLAECLAKRVFMLII